MRCSRLIAPAALVAVLALAGCSSQEGQPPAETTAAAEPTQAAPAIFVPGGSAGENKPIFDQTNLQTIATNGSASSVELVNALSTTGFDKAAMEVTFDRTNVDLEADYIIVSVKIGVPCGPARPARLHLGRRCSRQHGQMPHRPHTAHHLVAKLRAPSANQLLDWNPWPSTFIR